MANGLIFLWAPRTVEISSSTQSADYLRSTFKDKAELRVVWLVEADPLLKKESCLVVSGVLV